MSDAEEGRNHKRLRKHKTLQKDHKRGKLALTNLFLILIELIEQRGSDNSWVERVGNAYLMGDARSHHDECACPSSKNGDNRLPE